MNDDELHFDEDDALENGFHIEGGDDDDGVFDPDDYDLDEDEEL